MARGRASEYAQLLELSMKRCTRCRTIKPLDAYSPRNANRGDLNPRSRCKDCCVTETIDRRGDYNVRRKLQRYGLTQNAFDLMVEKQLGKCAICGRSPEVFRIDHCHVTGKLRELLCFGCNVSLGHFQDNIETLKSAINYLRKHKHE